MDQSTLHKTGHYSQLYGMEQLRLAGGGKGDGMRLVQMRNGRGLSAVVVPDRCLDIYRLEYKGDNLSFFSPVGWVGSSYYNPEEFMRSFTAGFLTTCGTESAGSSCEDDGEITPMHGRVGNVPAENVCCHTDYSGNQPAMRISGSMNESVIFKGKLVLSRQISMHSDENVIVIQDELENQGGETRPCTMLYHMNLGYPLLDEGVEIMMPTRQVIPRDPRAAEGTEEYNQFPAPIAGFEEQCYYHDMAAGQDGFSCVAVYNKKIGKGVEISYDTSTLNRFIQWKMPGVRDYVLGLEPSNGEVEGRKKMRTEHKLKFIEPGECKKFTIRVKIIDGDQEAAVTREKINTLLK